MQMKPTQPLASESAYMDLLEKELDELQRANARLMHKYRKLRESYKHARAAIANDLLIEERLSAMRDF